ncbi:hypothetical protein [Roseococcus sp.]|uniref:hypothetical protein n=1 Tax=Roseococcus sp. TaxID=2109646 RepID=UPI003BAD57F8
MTNRRTLMTILAAAMIALPMASFAQGNGSDTPRPPGSDPSARVDSITGRGPASPGTTGNPTGRRVDRPATSTAPTNQAVTPANPNSQRRPGAPSAPGSHTN